MDENITASSFDWGSYAPPYRSRFSSTGYGDEAGAWVAGIHLTSQWIQADFLVAKSVVKVATKGRDGGMSMWVTKYQLKYGLSSNEADFEYVTTSGGDVITFNGNSDRDTIVENEFSMIFAQVMRLCPTDWDSRIALRWELYGC